MRPAGPVLAALFLLAACGQQPEQQAAMPATAVPQTPLPPADAVDFTREVNLLGNEPFWALKVRNDRLTFSAPDRADLEAPNPGPVVTDGQAVWTADASGVSLKATLTAAVCQDGMSGLFYPFKAVVEVEGMMLEGCAAYADAMPREGG
jgi:uncharacterized membrane protein